MSIRDDDGAATWLDVGRGDAARRQQLGWVAGSYAALRRSRLGALAVGRLGAYRLAAGLTAGRVAAALVAAWGAHMLLALGAWALAATIGAAPPPGFAVAWAAGAAAMLAATVWACSWWRHYRHSEDQARHRLLARGGLPAGLAGRHEVARRWSGATLVAKGAVLRPDFCSRAAVSRAYAVVPALFPDEYQALCAEYGHRGAAAPAIVAEDLARGLARVAVPHGPASGNLGRRGGAAVVVGECNGGGR